MNEALKRWKEANRERHLLHKKTYREKHREIINEKHREYRKRRKKEKALPPPPSLIVCFH